jgi:uncharacterized coiled-coil protein SlyX
MGQFAKDWESLKQIIRQKDDALDRASAQLTAQAQQIAQFQKQLAGLQNQFDASDQKAAAELRQVIADNAAAPAAPVAPVASAAPAARTASAAPASPATAPSAAPAMTTFTK